MGPIEINGAIATIATLMDAVKKTIEIKGALKDQSQAAELQKALVEARSATLELLEKHSALTEAKKKPEEQVVQLKAWDEDKVNYTFQAIAPGVFAYAYTPKTQSSKPAHYLCPECYNEGMQSILQFDEPRNAWRCSRCRMELPLPRRSMPQSRITR